MTCTKYTVNTERWDDHSDAHFAHSFDNADDGSVVQGDHVKKLKTHTHICAQRESVAKSASTCSQKSQVTHDQAWSPHG